MRETTNISRTFALVPGLVIGAVWVVLAGLALWMSARGYAHDRSGWGLGWGLVGTLLMGAGLAALIGSWWHNSRVNPHHH